MWQIINVWIFKSYHHHRFIIVWELYNLRSSTSSLSEFCPYRSCEKISGCHIWESILLYLQFQFAFTMALSSKNCHNMQFIRFDNPFYFSNEFSPSTMRETKYDRFKYLTIFAVSIRIYYGSRQQNCHIMILIPFNLIYVSNTFTSYALKQNIEHLAEASYYGHSFAFTMVLRSKTVTYRYR